MHMVGLAVELFESAVELLAYVGEDTFECRQMRVGEYFMPILGDEDQMYMHVIDAVSSLAYFIVSRHKTKYNGSMTAYKRYNYRAYPNGGQRKALTGLFGACRHAYNWVIDQRRLMYMRHGVTQSYNQLSAMFNVYKREPENRWLLSVSSTPLQQSLRHADTAYRNFFRRIKQGNTGRRAGFPRFKSKHDGEQSAEFTKSARYKLICTQGCKWAFLTLPKIGRIKLRWTRELPSTPNTVTIMRHADGSYEASFTVPIEDESPAPEPVHEACGIDMGLESFATIIHDDGIREKIAHPHTLTKSARKLHKVDKDVSRKQKGSKNYRKARLKKAKAYAHVRNQRKDMTFKLAFKVAVENQAVAVETLNIKGLARTRMAKSLLDAAWGMFLTRLQQDCLQYGRTFRRISQWYPSSQICSQCGRRDGRKPLNIRTWNCPRCGTLLDRDYNAAVNILDAAGLAESLNARGDGMRRNLASAERNASVSEAGTLRTGILH